MVKRGICDGRRHCNRQQLDEWLREGKRSEWSPVVCVGTCGPRAPVLAFRACCDDCHYVATRAPYCCTRRRRACMLAVLNTYARHRSLTRSGAPPPTPDQLIAAGTPGLFSPRGSFSLDVLGGTIIMFGGLTRNVALEPFAGCGVANADCVTFNEVGGIGPRSPPHEGQPKVGDNL